MENSLIIKIEKLVKRFPVGKTEFTALNNISINFGTGEFTGLVGPSGSGKTTLLNIIGSLDSPSEGDVEVLGKSVSSLNHKQSAQLRNHHNVEFTLLLQQLSGSERKKAVMDALDWVGLTDKIKSRPSMLSGGECQRVAIARSMVKRPEIVLADEPTANLDSKNSHHILQTMKNLNRELKTTFIFATHDEKVMKYLDRIISLEDGKIVKDKLMPNSKS